MTTEEFNKCVDENADSVFRFIMKSIKEAAQAEDITQAAFEKLWRKHKSVNAEKARSYLFTTAYHTMIDHFRINKRIVHTADFDPESKISQSLYTGAKDVINQALSKLPQQQQTVLLLRDYEGYSYDEIADISGLNIVQVKVYIYRARKSLQRYLISINHVI